MPVATFGHLLPNPRRSLKVKRVVRPWAGFPTEATDTDGHPGTGDTTPAVVSPFIVSWLRYSRCIKYFFYLLSDKWEKSRVNSGA